MSFDEVTAGKKQAVARNCLPWEEYAWMFGAISTEPELAMTKLDALAQRLHRNLPHEQIMNIASQI